MPPPRSTLHLHASPLHILKKLNAKLFARLHFHLHLHWPLFNAAAAEVAPYNGRNIFSLPISIPAQLARPHAQI